MLQKDSLQVTLKWWPLFPPPPRLECIYHAMIRVLTLINHSLCETIFLGDWHQGDSPPWCWRASAHSPSPAHGEELRLCEFGGTWRRSNVKRMSWTPGWGAAPVLSTQLRSVSVWWFVNDLRKSCPECRDECALKDCSREPDRESNSLGVAG